MINVKNASDKHLHPAGVPSRPGSIVAIDDRRWKQFAGTTEGKNLLRMGMLEVEDAAPKPRAKAIKPKPAPKADDVSEPMADA